MKSFMASPSTVERKWYVVDAEGKTLGRLASEVANVLRGKNKPTYTPHIDTGDYVIVVNAEKIQVTGKKLDQKIYYHHSICRWNERSYIERNDAEETGICNYSRCKGYASKGTFGTPDA